MMLKMELKQIEADVVFVLSNNEADMVSVYPYWECELDKRQLMEYAAQLGLEFGERCGGGFVDIVIHDYRDTPA